MKGEWRIGKWLEGRFLNLILITSLLLSAGEKSNQVKHHLCKCTAYNRWKVESP
jgi:hypothetical protein